MLPQRSNGTLNALLVAGIRRKYGTWTTEVDPRTIQYVYTSRQWPTYVKRWPFFACPGDWDLEQRRHEPYRLKQMQELFVDGVAFRDTQHYRTMLNELETQGVTGSPRLVSEVEIDAYFDRVVKLYQSIERSGYRRSDSVAVAAGGEITLRIGRNGQLIKCGPRFGTEGAA